jgi:hypothetical protein
MAANTSPIFTLTPKNGFAKVTGVDGSQDGTDADVKLVFTSDATVGSFFQRLICQPMSTSGSTTTSAAALRVYLNNGSTVGTAANNQLIKEFSLAAIAVNVAGTTASIGYELPFNFQLAPGYAIYVGVTAMAANTQWNVTFIGGDYE